MMAARTAGHWQASLQIAHTTVQVLGTQDKPHLGALYMWGLGNETNYLSSVSRPQKRERERERERGRKAGKGRKEGNEQRRMIYSVGQLRNRLMAAAAKNGLLS